MPVRAPPHTRYYLRTPPPSTVQTATRMARRQAGDRAWPMRDLLRQRKAVVCGVAQPRIERRELVRGARHAAAPAPGVQPQCPGRQAAGGRAAGAAARQRVGAVGRREDQVEAAAGCVAHLPQGSCAGSCPRVW